MIKGLDNGYSFTKDNEKRIIKSAISYTDKMVTGSKHITIDGKDYYVGVGQMTSDIDKTDADINKACTLMNLVISGDTDYYLVVGLPIGQFKAQNERFRNTVMSYNNCKIEYQGNERKIRIHDVTVFPQGAASLYAIRSSKGDKIIIDVGGLTIDVALIQMNYGNPHIEKSDTWYKGMRTLFSNIIEQVNLKYGLRLETKEAERILLNGLRIHGIEQNLDFLQPTLQDYLEPIVDELKLNYPCETTPIYLCGGGANLLYGAFKKRFYEVIMVDDSQFSNAIGYYNVGLTKYEKYIEPRKVVNYVR
jgi:plasmid segregation protein ParM